MLRDFLYLNTDAVTSYLSQLEGYNEITIDETSNNQKKKGLKGGFSGIGGEIGRDDSSSTKRILATTDEAKFQKLCDILEENNSIQYLENFDEEIWNQIKRREIIELIARTKMPDQYSSLGELNNLPVITDLLPTMIQNPESNDEAMAMKYFTSSINKINEKPVPLILKTSLDGHIFFTKLDRKYLRCNVTDLDSNDEEITVIGKVQRILRINQKDTVFSLVPEIQNLMKLGGNSQSVKNIPRESRSLLEFEIEGPAIIIIPTAIFI